MKTKLFLIPIIVGISALLLTGCGGAGNRGQTALTSSSISTSCQSLYNQAVTLAGEVPQVNGLAIPSETACSAASCQTACTFITNANTILTDFYRDLNVCQGEAVFSSLQTQVSTIEAATFSGGLTLKNIYDNITLTASINLVCVGVLSGT
ncbi:MAG: hypothetical protein NTY22_02055, partial [Proteobacteria bacterium]|nr:hypothetical protein [Pseudomonadota bacterium]